MPRIVREADVSWEGNLARGTGAITPRMTGSRQMRWRFIGEETSRTTSSMAPSGVRTATAQHDGPRIITPSRTACPP